jgi:hypothetical protein
MSNTRWTYWEDKHPARKLAGSSARWMMAYLFGMWLLWLVGVEGIYENPTPFYALLYPSFTSVFPPVAALLAMWASGRATKAALYETSRFTRSRKIAGYVLWGLVLLLFAVALAGEARKAGAEWLETTLREIRWNLQAVAVFCVALILWIKAVRRFGDLDRRLQRRSLTWMLFGLVLFCFVFSGAIAWLRDGIGGVTEAYDRQTHEYIGDIGLGGSITGFLCQYEKLHPYLSMHAKVHPPGPVAVLWILSFVAGRSPLGLSLATMLVGSLAVVPLFFWVRDMFHAQMALICCSLYVLMPSIVLFTATSADILFMPFVIATLFLFWRAIHRPSLVYAVGAGLLYAVLSLLSFSLLTMGAFFGIVGLWRFREKQMRFTVVKTALVMVAAFVGLHVLIWAGSGFKMASCFELAMGQFSLDQANLDQFTPRYGPWFWKTANPMCWFYFAGIPVSLLALRRIFRPEQDTKCLFLVFGFTFVVLSMLYLGRGEGERSAMYVLPFVVVPAAHYLDEQVRRAGTDAPLAAAVAFLAFQSWFTETFFYTYW